jgi:hypothetical protein
VVDRGPAMRRLAALAALGGTVAVVAALVLAHQHSFSEAAGGWMAGTAASLATLRGLSGRPARTGGPASAWPIVAFACCALVTGMVPVGYLMVKAALVLSGNHRPTPWAQQQHFPTLSDRRQACPVHHSFNYPGSDRARSTADRRIRC